MNYVNNMPEVSSVGLDARGRGGVTGATIRTAGAATSGLLGVSVSSRTGLEFSWSQGYIFNPPL